MTKAILVVGAAGGVGLATAKELLLRGHSVIGTVFDESEAERAHGEVPEFAELHILDVADHAALERSVGEIASRTPLWGVAMCAAIAPPPGPLELVSPEQLKQVLDINTVSALALYRAVLPTLRRCGGRLVFVSSYAGFVAMPFFGAYGASKFGLEALADTMRREASTWGVDIVLVEPGGIDTPMACSATELMARERAELTAEHNAIYGGRYDAMMAGFQNTEFMTAEQVAGVISDCFSGDRPQARYRLGKDTAYLAELVDRLPDRELDDALIALLFPD